MKYLKGAVAVVMLWYVAALLVASPIIPFPHAVAIYLGAHLVANAVHLHVLSSLYRIVMGMALALICAIPIGMLAGKKHVFDRTISPVLYLLYPLPKIAFLPVFMVLFGIGNLSKIMLIAIIVFFPAAVTIRDGVKAIPAAYFELAEAYRLTHRQVLKHILWPATLPRVFSSLRITLGISLSVLFISENYAATYGLGYYIMNNWVMANYVGMYGGIVMLSLTGLLLYILIDAIEIYATPYTRASRKNM